MRLGSGRSSSTLHTREAKLAAAVAVTVALLAAAWSLADHAAFGTHAFDSGVIDNSLWRLTHGYDDVSSLNGHPLFADHPSGILLLLLPVYVVAPSSGLAVQFVLRAASVGMVVWSAWLIADHLGLDRATRWTLIGATAVGPGTILVAGAEANTVGLVVGPMALASALAIRASSPGWFGVLVGLAAMARPEVAVGVVLLGLAVRAKRPVHGRIAMVIGAVIGASGVVWLLVAGDTAGVSGHLGHLGDSLGSAFLAALRRPWDALEPVLDPDPWLSLVIWLCGFGLAAPLLSPRWLGASLPLLAIPFLGSWEQADERIWQYWHLLLPLGMVAAAMSVGRGKIAPGRFRMLILVLVPVAWIVGLGGTGMRMFPSLSDAGASADVLVDAIDSRGYASVSVPDPVVPHVTDRAEVHRFPLPFECGDIEIAGYRGPDRLPKAVMLQDGSGDGSEWPETLARLGYEEVAAEGDFSLWEAATPQAAPVLECG